MEEFEFALEQFREIAMELGEMEMDFRGQYTSFQFSRFSFWPEKGYWSFQKYLELAPFDGHLKKRADNLKEVARAMSVMLIEPILDRYVAQAERRKKDWNPKEVEALLLKLRKEILHCLK